MSAGGPTRIVIVDDHPLVRDAIRRTLAAPDMAVVGEAGTGPEGLAIAASLAPDLILVDLNLPGMSGHELLRDLRTRAPGARLVVLTASSSADDAEQAILAGAAGYLTKDLPPDALRRAIRGLRIGQLVMPRILAAEVVRRLAATARRAGPSDDDGLAALSPREREVLRLVATGLTNREIGTALGLSPRTVERHIGSVLSKLGVPNRAAASRVWQEVDGR
jgi:DNA-binding NarL/FixJ family response regulator